jgi:hypothetical protein
MINTSRIARTENLSRNETRLWLKGIPTPFPLGRTGRTRLNEFLGDAN